MLNAPDDPYVVSGAAVAEPAIGGTLSAIALSLAAGRAALTEMLTEDAFAPPNLARDWPTGYEHHQQAPAALEHHTRRSARVPHVHPDGSRRRRHLPRSR